MRVDQFFYQLPEALIASEPTPERSGSRLLVLDGASGAVTHQRFVDLVALAHAGDLLVMNDTRVIPARLFGHKASGGRVEVLVERVLDGRRLLAQVRAGKSLKPGSALILDGGHRAEMLGREGDLFLLRFDGDMTVMEILDAVGHVPLPPYIARSDAQLDRERYQTVYASVPGAVAAPTAGLHFDEALLDRLRTRGVNIGFVTLHVGAGTFQPVRVNEVSKHRMHSEVIDVSPALCEQVMATRRAGKRVIAVGTTSVRCLETAGRGGHMEPVRGETDIFIYPGYRFKMVDALITNFHLPESTLLMLVSAFGGYHRVMAAYRQAVAGGYRFFSYGDAMFMTRNDQSPGESLP